jgi:hypothetical protein
MYVILIKCIHVDLFILSDLLLGSSAWISKCRECEYYVIEFSNIYSKQVKFHAHSQITRYLIHRICFFLFFLNFLLCRLQYVLAVFGLLICLTCTRCCYRRNQEIKEKR